MTDHFCIVKTTSRTDAEALAELANTFIPNINDDFKSVSKKELIELIIPNLKQTFIKAKQMEYIESFMGCVQNGSHTSVKISQDEVVQSDERVTLVIGKKPYYSHSLGSCIEQATEAGEHENLY